MASTETLTGSFTGLAVSSVSGISERKYNVSIFGTFSGTVEVQRSFDDGVTWQAIKTITAPYEGVGIEVERKVSYRLECTVFTSGSIYYRLGPSSF